ncbi:hypothetical protein BC938DRAFT_482170 [Jimgerdemannia flammicorona]|uniref:Transcription factor IIIC subunit 5 HTH domain-containing protein n=1 Tax=Jimgerdemannia flammicorona TaxID=994334 RepID=A0A433R0P3_9FUNG|nr:hypothetical protein BC938DRAFT_482170 [Jimgerdemannia flammicorona]
MVSGAWRDCWIKYGVDPRKDRELRLYVEFSRFRCRHHICHAVVCEVLVQSYQLLDVRSTAKPRSFARAKRTTHVRPDPLIGQEVAAMEGDSEEESSVKRFPPDLSHMFDGKTKPRDTGIFQMCDVTDPQLRPLIETKDYLRPICNVSFCPGLTQKEDGWYDHSIVHRLRRVIRRKFTELHNGHVPQEQDYHKLVEGLDAGENEEEEENAPGLEETAGTTAKAGKEKDGVSGKVEELMRNLQHAQQQAKDFDGEFEQEFPIEEVEEYEDVFGEDEDEDEEAEE